MRARLIISQSITLRGAGAGRTTIEWRTGSPYESTVEVAAGVSAHISGLTIAHASPSVANNYAVYSRAGSLDIQECRISSSTGSGVGCDGGMLTAKDCVIDGCERHGLVIAGDLDGGAAEVRLQGCKIERNGRSGAVVLDGGDVRAEQCSFANNRQYGLELRVRLWTRAVR